MGPFYRWSSTVSRLKALRGESLIWATKSPVVPGTRFDQLRKDEKLTRGLESGKLIFGIQCSKPLYHNSINHRK